MTQPQAPQPTPAPATPAAAPRDRKIPLLIGGIVVAGVLLLGSLGATAVVAGHAKMGVFDNGPYRIEMKQGGPDRGMFGPRGGFEGPRKVVPQLPGSGPRGVIPGGPSTQGGGNGSPSPAPSPTAPSNG